MTKRLSIDKINKIRTRRSHGLSIPEISRVVGVGKATVCKYIKGVEILPEFKNDWLDRRKSSVKRKKDAEAKAEIRAEKIVKDLSVKERLLVIAALYWAEGAKVDFNLTNTDPDLIKVFIHGLRNVLKITDDRFRLNIRIYQDMDASECVNFWLGITGLSKENISSVNILVGRKNGKLRYGICRLRVKKGGDMLKYLVAVRHKIIERL